MELPIDLKILAFELKKELGIESHETFKLEKNSRGYGWEIKLFSDNSQGETQKDRDAAALERLENINKVLVERYGTTEW